MLKQKLKAFTLVELIVVITILAILGTIAFMSFQGYSASARDSKRISDLSNIRTSLELFGLKTGKFPVPNNSYEITYSGSELRSQGIFGEENLTNVEKIGKLPLDPLTEQEYTYSVTNVRKEFELGTVLESNNIGYNNINTANAASKKIVTAYIKGNYNGKTLKTSTGGIDYILAVPSIINGDQTLTDIIDLINAKKMVYNGYSNLPASYTGSSFEVNGEDDLVLVNASELVVYSGDLDDLTDPDNSTQRSIFLENIADAYDGTSIETEAGISEIVNIDFEDTENTGPLVEFIAGTIVNNDLGGDLELVPVSIPSSGSDGGDESTLVCNDMTEDNVANLNNAFGGTTGYGDSTKEEWCSLTSLNLRGKGLITLPDEIGYLKKLEELDLRFNSLGNLNFYFDIDSSKLTQTNISTSGEKISIWGNGTTIYIQIGSLSFFTLNDSVLFEGQETYIAESCTDTYTSSDTSIATISGEFIKTIGIGTTNITPVGGNCSTTTPITLTVSPHPYPVTYICGPGTWTTVDENCDICDVNIGSQTWAGCNSTLGTGYEYPEGEDYVSCYDYNGTYKETGCNFNSTDKEIDYFNAESNNTDGNTGVDNIWGKLYSWSSVTMGETDIDGNVITSDNDTICPVGWHVPSDAEWEQLETTMNYGINLRHQEHGSAYPGNGWKNHDNESLNTNIVNALKIPLAGNRFTNGLIGYSGRGDAGNLWSNTTSPDWGGTTAYYFNFDHDNTGSYRRDPYKWYGFSVRCLKD